MHADAPNRPNPPNPPSRPNRPNPPNRTTPSRPRRRRRARISPFLAVTFALMAVVAATGCGVPDHVLDAASSEPNGSVPPDTVDLSAPIALVVTDDGLAG